jgi:hypothetical protein
MRHPLTFGKDLQIALLRAEDFEQEKAGANHNAGVRNVEIGPVVVIDADGEEVHDVVEADPVVKIAEGSPENKGEGDRGERKGAACTPQQEQDNKGRNDRESNEADADAIGRQIFQQREGSAGVEHVR